MAKLRILCPEAIAGLIGLSFGILFVGLCEINRPPLPAAVIENRYERAQRQTVLIQSEHGQGSGVVVVRHNRIFVWTAAHVVSGVSEVTIKNCLHWEGHKAGEMIFKARVISRDEDHDFALLWLDAPATGYFLGAEFDNIIYPRVGTEVFHVGNFLGENFDGSVSTGILSQVGILPVTIEDWHWPMTDQIAGTVVPGSSGGPVFRSDNGKVLGIVVGGVGRGALGFASYAPLRVLASEPAIRWAVWGTLCPPDSVLVEMVLKNRMIPTNGISDEDEQ